MLAKMEESKINIGDIDRIIAEIDEDFVLPPILETNPLSCRLHKHLQFLEYPLIQVVLAKAVSTA